VQVVGGDVRAGERRGDQVKPAVEKGSPAAGGWGAASWSMCGVSRGERRGSKGVLHFDKAMSRGDKADSASHVGGAAHAGWHSNQGQPETDSAAVNHDGSCLRSTQWEGSGVVCNQPWVGHCSTGPGPIRCTIFFQIIQNLLKFCHSNLLLA
jgi:hypothetical protein